MKLALADLVEPVTPEDAAATAAFYRARTPGVGPTSAREVIDAREARPVPARAQRHVIGDGRTTVYVVTPAVGAVLGVYLYIPPGGFYSSAAAAAQARNAALADDFGIAVVTVDYSLAPEHPWPAAPNDCEAVALWLLDNAMTMFGTTRLAVGGMSAGANLAAATSVRLRDRGLGASFVGAVLEAGSFDLSGTTPAGRRIADEYFVQAYAGHVEDRTAADVSPIFADLSGLPPVLVLVGSGDVLLADNLAMAAALAAAGNDIDLRVYPCVPHGFTQHSTPIARRAQRDIGAWLTAAFAVSTG